MFRTQVFWIFTVSSIGLGLLLPLSLRAQICPSGNSSSTAYIQRNDDRRCEGIITSQAARNNLELVSFTAGEWGNRNPLQLTIPGQSNQDIAVRVRSRDHAYYQLDPLELSYRNNRHQFRWSDRVLKNIGIDLSSLEALASSTFGSQPVYHPVLLDRPAGSDPLAYTFVLYADDRFKVTQFKIFPSQGTSPIFSASHTTFQTEGVTDFVWENAYIAPAGRYRLDVEAEIKQERSSPEVVSRSFILTHDPAWLR